MKKIYLLIFVFIFCMSNVKAFEIVYPKTNPVKIDAPSTFFIGYVSSGENLKINNTIIDIAKNGAFAYVVPLNYGINKFDLTSEIKTINYKIERGQDSKSNNNDTILVEYPAVSFYVKNDNTPLRLTPVNKGINRLSHLCACTNVTINGEKGAFYRVYLNSKLNGWIAKTDVEQTKDSFKKAILKELKMEEEKNYYKYELILDKKIPYILQEENGLTCYFFNIEGTEDNTYILKIPIDKLFGYEACYKKNNLIIKVRKTPCLNKQKLLNNITIAVDAGHGGCENGAIGGFGDKEKDINLAIAKKLKQELESRGAKVIMTREDDIQIPLNTRVKIAHEKEALILISIHSNALPDGKDPNKYRGTSIYYYHNQAKSLAENILTEMTTQLKTQNDKVRQGSLALVRSTFNLSVLIEVAYIINPDDYALLLDNNFQTNCAKAISDGIEKYLSHDTINLER